LKPSLFNYSTYRIDLVSDETPGRNTQGNPPNNPLRSTSPNVTETLLTMLPSPDLPALASAGHYQLLSVDSLNGTDFTFTAANASGYGLFAASSSDLVEDENGDWVLDPSTTLSPVFLDGSQTMGTYNGSNKDLVLRANSGGQAVFSSGYTYSAAPAALLSLPDGQSVTVDREDIADGDDMLWLLYDDGDATHGFVLVPTTSSDPQLTVTDVAVTEGNSGTTNATFTVTLSAAAASDVTVQYATVGGTATSGTDFTATSGTLTFTPGQTTKTITVPVAGDTTYEVGEDFFVALSSATNAGIADRVAGGTIQNDDAQPTISIGDVSQVEGDSGTTSFVFTVTLSNPSWQTITVDFATADGSATAGSDYEAASGTLTFLPGETTKTIVVTVYGDTVAEGGGPGFGAAMADGPTLPGGTGEDFVVNLSGPAKATLLDAQGLGFIQDDD
jgi:hypothetical protein